MNCLVYRLAGLGVTATWSSCGLYVVAGTSDRAVVEATGLGVMLTGVMLCLYNRDAGVVETEANGVGLTYTWRSSSSSSSEFEVYCGRAT